MSASVPDHLKELYFKSPSLRCDDHIPSQALLLPNLSNFLTPYSTGSAAIAAAIIFLHHGQLDAAHNLAQDVGGPDGDFAHAIMHRMEGDLSNACYWHRKHGVHPIHESVRGCLNDTPCPDGIDSTTYTPHALTQAMIDQQLSPQDPRVLSLHRLETALLFDHCLKQL